MGYTYKSLGELFKANKSFRVNTLTCEFLTCRHQKLVYSYDTIIAVIDTNKNTCYVVDKKYSRTTTNQQSLLRKLKGSAFNDVYTVSVDKILEKFPNLTSSRFIMYDYYARGEFQGR